MRLPCVITEVCRKSTFSNTRFVGSNDLNFLFVDTSEFIVDDSIVTFR